MAYERKKMGQIQNEQAMAEYQQAMSEYEKRKKQSQDAALGMGIGAGLAAPIPMVGPFIAAGLGAGATLVGHYGPGDEPDAPELVAERELALKPYQRRAGRGMASDPGMGGADPYAMMAADQGLEGHQIQAIQDLRRKRQQRLAGMMAPQPA
tara:strand:- start:112 stop:567 length:456 start_codon:yes stop_codon:yes gene_type:complete